MPGRKSTAASERSFSPTPPVRYFLLQPELNRAEGRVNAQQQDALVLDESMIGKADIVVADLPCSGLGVMRRKTDIKYKMTLQTEQELVSLQRNMLETVCQYVKVGGTLLYSTCTMDKMENEDNVTWFLKQHPQFELVKMQQIFPQE